MTTHEEQQLMDRSIVYANMPSSQGPSMFFLSQEHQVDGWEHAMGGAGWMHGAGWMQYQESDISDLLSKGGQYFKDSGNSYGPNQSYRDGARKVMESYEAFSRTHAGREMISTLGNPKWDGYAMLDLEGGALAATISYTDGRKVLAWNSKYMHCIDAGLLAGPHLEEAIMNAIDRYGHPLGDPLVSAAANFYEASYHEPVHNKHGRKVFNRSRESEEFATYMETATFYRGLAEKVKDSSYAMSKFYEAIAERSEYKARMFGKGGQDAQEDAQIDSLEGIANTHSHSSGISDGDWDGSGWAGDSGNGSTDGNGDGSGSMASSGEGGGGANGGSSN